jgi:hypothetical protein
MFDEKTRQNLKAYVYMLINPNDSRKPFYIGKGNNNRVFDHINLALTDLDAVSAKYDVIRQIIDSGKSVEHIILRHGLSDAEAFHVEATLIDALEYSGILLKNKQGGHHSIEKGLMTAEEIVRLYNAEKLTYLADNCVIININRKYPKKKLIGEDSIADEIYKATKGIWTMKKPRLFGRNDEYKIKFVLSEYKGLIVEVFEVDRWYSEPRGYSNKKAKKYGDVKDGWSFEGHVAEPAIRNMYINKSLHKEKGQAGAIRYNLVKRPPTTKLKNGNNPTKLLKRVNPDT